MKSICKFPKSIDEWWCHQKEREMISGVEIPNIVNINSIRFAEMFRNRKNVTIGMVSKPKSF
jgi:hypothetical protein